MAEERDVILNHFRAKHGFYYPFVATLFGTGARQSEVIALRWGDIDLSAGTLSISKSHYMGENGPTKTAASERVVALGMPVIAALKAIKPLHVTETDLGIQKQRGTAYQRRQVAKEILVQGAKGFRYQAEKILRHAPHVHLDWIVPGA